MRVRLQRRHKLKDVRGFLGLPGYHRSFIHNFGTIIRHLTLLIGKEIQFDWTAKQQETSDKLRRVLSSESVLAHPNFELPFILSCGASNYALSAILSQNQNDQERPLSFASRSLNEHEINYSFTHKKLLSVIFEIKVYRCFLYGTNWSCRLEMADNGKKPSVRSIYAMGAQIFRI